MELPASDSEHELEPDQQCEVYLLRLMSRNNHAAMTFTP